MDPRFDIVVDGKILHKYDDYDQALYVAMSYICCYIYDHFIKEVVFTKTDTGRK